MRDVSGGNNGLCRVLHARGGVVFARHRPAEQRDRRVAHAPSVPIGIRRHAERPDHGQPSRGRPARHPLDYSNATKDPGGFEALNCNHNPLILQGI
jgi:hypothetical protein